MIIPSQVCFEYHQNDIACLPKLQENMFATAVTNNLDHNLTSATSKSLFHGTTISIFEHSSIPLSPEPFWISSMKADRWKKLRLPQSFTEIKPTPKI